MTLHCAAKSGDITSVIDLYEQGISLDICDEHQNTPLHYAAGHGHYEVAEFLIDKKCALNVANSDGNTPLWIAVGAGHLNVAHLLRMSGAVITLHLSCRAGWLDEVTSLVASEECDINAKNSDGDTPLSLAASNLHKDIVLFLIHSGADINCLINVGSPWHFKAQNWTLLHFACQLKWLDVVKTMVERNPCVDLDVKTSVGDTPLAIAARSGDRKIVKFLIQSGADINILLDKNGWSLLHTACQMEWPDVVIAIVEKYPDCDLDMKFNNLFTGDESTPMLYAAILKNKDMVNLFLDLGADVNACDADNYTILHFASCSRWPDVIKKCIEAGLDVNARTESGSTPLHLACQRREIEIVKLLLEMGADVNIRDNMNETALNVVLTDAHYLCSESDCSCPNIIRLLMNHGAIFECSDYGLLCHNEGLKKSVLGDVDICTQAFINKYNNVDLPSIYHIPSSVKLPSMKNLKINASLSAAREIHKFVVNEIETKGFCNVVEKCPSVLQILSVRSFMNHYE